MAAAPKVFRCGLCFCTFVSVAKRAEPHSQYRWAWRSVCLHYWQVQVPVRTTHSIQLSNTFSSLSVVHHDVCKFQTEMMKQSVHPLLNTALHYAPAWHKTLWTYCIKSICIFKSIAKPGASRHLKLGWAEPSGLSGPPKMTDQHQKARPWSDEKKWSWSGI